MSIPFLDLKTQYQKINSDIQTAIKKVLESTKFVQNEFCHQFAQDFLKVHGGHFGVGCSSGTSALSLALKALKIGIGDEVITVNNTFFATVEAIASVGARPVLVDCLPDTYGINCQLLEKAITRKTKAIIPVHLYGNPCDMDTLCSLAREYNLSLIEDCAQAHLATYKNRPVGTFGEMGTFSFYPGKNLGAYGDAGFVLTKNQKLLESITMHLNHGRMTKYEHQFMGDNKRMDDIQAAILSVKCQYIHDWTERRIQIAKQYDEIFQNKGYKVINVEKGAKCVYHLYIVEVNEREEFIHKLKAHDIGYAIHYPIPMSLQPACQSLGHKRGDFPISEEIASKIISLPIYPEMSNENVNRIGKVFTC